MGICRSCANPMPSAASRCAYCGRRQTTVRTFGILVARLAFAALLGVAILEWQGLHQFVGGLLAGIFHG